MILIEHAERFGLAQLHQLRGRVGRGGQRSACLLVHEAASEESRERIRIMCESSDGFRIAEEDLRLRGPGELFGRRQSGCRAFASATCAATCRCSSSAQALARGSCSRATRELAHGASTPARAARSTRWPRATARW